MLSPKEKQALANELKKLNAISDRIEGTLPEEEKLFREKWPSGGLHRHDEDNPHGMHRHHLEDDIDGAHVHTAQNPGGEHVHGEFEGRALLTGPHYHHNDGFGYHWHDEDEDEGGQIIPQDAPSVV